MKKFLKILVAGILAVGTLFSFAGCGKKKIGVQTGTTGEFFVKGDADWGFDGIDGYKAKGFDNGGLAVSALKNGYVDYVIIDQGPANELKKAMGGIKVVNIPLTEEDYAYGVDKNNPQLLSDINAILESEAFETKLASIMAAYSTGEGINPVTSAQFDENNMDGQLVVATNAAFPPFEYKDGDKFAGIDMEVAAYLAQELGMQLVIRDMDFNAVVTSVGKNGVDVAMAGLTITEERKKSINFTTSYYTSAQVLITLESDTTFDNCQTADDVLAKLKEIAK